MRTNKICRGLFVSTLNEVKSYWILALLPSETISVKFARRSNHEEWGGKLAIVGAANVSWTPSAVPDELLTVENYCRYVLIYRRLSIPVCF